MFPLIGLGIAVAALFGYYEYKKHQGAATVATLTQGTTYALQVLASPQSMSKTWIDPLDKSQPADPIDPTSNVNIASRYIAVAVEKGNNWSTVTPPSPQNVAAQQTYLSGSPAAFTMTATWNGPNGTSTSQVPLVADPAVTNLQVYPLPAVSQPSGTTSAAST